MVNTELLKQIILKKGKTIDDVAKAIDVDKSTLYRRLPSNGEDFSIAEVEGICSFLNLTKKERKSIFLLV